MPNEQYIDFVSKLLKNLHIPSHIMEEPLKYMSSEVDGGLRAMIFGENDYSKLLTNSPAEAKENVIYRFFDEYRCNYIFFRIPREDINSYYFVGPYLPSLPSENFIIKKSEQLLLSVEKTDQLRAYYRNLPIIEDENVLFGIIDTLGSFLWGSPENFNVEHVGYEIPDKRRPV